MNTSWDDRWFEDISAATRCASCSTACRREDLTVVGNRDQYWYLRYLCHACGTQGVGIVIVHDIEPQAPRSSLTADDVLNAADALRGCRTLMECGL